MLTSAAGAAAGAGAALFLPIMKCMKCFVFKESLKVYQFNLIKFINFIISFFF